MPELLRFQSDFAIALRERQRTPAMQRWLAGDGELVERRMAIYRANMVAAAEKALASAYPVIRQVVGEDFFHGLAREYQRGAPSTSGDLTGFGESFGAFLAAFEHARKLVHVTDLQEAVQIQSEFLRSQFTNAGEHMRQITGDVMSAAKDSMKPKF